MNSALRVQELYENRGTLYFRFSLTGVRVSTRIAVLKKRVSIAESFGWSIVSGLTAIVWRDKGEVALNTVRRSLMAAELSDRFLAALEKLGITGDTSAVTAAKYHYFSNSIGSLNMQYIEESPKKSELPSSRDRQHSIKVAWGGGAPVEVSKEFGQRFGIPVREGYGMTETSSFSVINVDGKHGSIDKAIDYFHVEIAGAGGTTAAVGKIGEIRVKAKEPNVLTKGYFRLGF